MSRLQQRRSQRICDDVINNAARRCVTQIEPQRWLTRHAERTGVHDQIEATRTVVEREIGGFYKMIQVYRVMLGAWREFIEQSLSFHLVAASQHNDEVLRR